MSRSRKPATPAHREAEDAETPRSERPTRRWPSDDPVELAAQLRRQLHRLEAPGEQEDSDDALRLATAYLKHAQTVAWRGVGGGDFDAPRDHLDSLLTVHPFLDAHLPELSPPARAAVEIYATFESFYVATAALEELRTRARLADRSRSAAERAVLRVLAANPDRHLRRGQVHERLDLDDEERPTVVRVGQILARLYHEGLLVRLQSSAQGNPDTAFYALSGVGRETAESLDLVQPGPHTELPQDNAQQAQWVAQLDELAAIVANPSSAPPDRSVAAGMLAHIPRSSGVSAEQLSESLDRAGVDPVAKAKIRRTYQANLVAGFSAVPGPFSQEDFRFVWDVVRLLRTRPGPRPAPRTRRTAVAAPPGKADTDS